MDILQVIETLGVPVGISVAVAIGLGYALMYLIKFITKEIKADIKNLYEITVKLIDSNRQSKDESRRMFTAMNVIKDILIKFFRNGK